jgi:hypothetical protein
MFVKTRKVLVSYILVLLSLGLAGQNPNCDPFFGKLVINEVLAGNDNTGSDEFGEFDDWVEIYNGSDQPINMQGIFLSDNHGNRTKFVFPDFVLPPDEVVVVWCDDQPDQGPFHAPFRLSGSGEEVGLYNQDTTSLDYVRYGNLPDDISVGRFPNGHGPFNVLIPTFNAPNTNSVQPGLVINEYQSSNESTVQDQWGGFDDWIELYNASNTPINLGGYFLSDRIGEPTQFVFPDTVIMPNEYLIVWCDQGLFEPGLHTFFRLGSDGDDILLSDSDTLTVDYVRFGVVTADETEGRFPNGTGPFTCLLPTHAASNGGVTSVDEQQRIKEIFIYPNPSTGEVFVEIDERQLGGVIRLFDPMGKPLKTERVTKSPHYWNLTTHPSGLYLVEYERQVFKIVLR